MEWSGCLCKKRDEALIIRTQSKKLAHLTNVAGGREVSDCSDQLGVWLQSLGSNNVAQVLYFLVHKVAFSRLQFQCYLLEVLDHQPKVLQM